MALVDTTWYCNAGDQSTTGHYAVVKRPQNTAVVAGQLVRQFTAPTVGNERVFVCIVAGTTANVADATWVLTRGAKTTDGTVTWMEATGQAALNGDLPNTATWSAVKTSSGANAVLGQIIKRSNNASYQICTTAGAMSASEPTFSDTAGVTTTDTTAVWTSLGPVSNFTAGMAPFARLASACASTWFAAGNTVYVGDNHAESQATAITIAPILSGSTVGRIICHDHSGSYPPTSSDLRTSATISTTASSVNTTFSPSGGGIYVYGVTFIAGAGVSSGGSYITLTPTNAYYYFDNCLFKLANTSASTQSIQLSAASAGVMVWNNCTVSFGAAAHNIEAGVTVNFTWQNTGPVLAGGSVAPTNLFGIATQTRLHNITLEALDLSQITGGLFNYGSFFAMGTMLIKDCKLNAAFTVPTPAAFGQTFQLVRSSA